jgi:hypothetical protein
MNSHQAEYHHEAIIKLVCYSNEFVFCLEQQQAENIHFPVSWSSSHTAIGSLVYSDEQPHPEHIKNYMNITHIVFVDIVICHQVEKTVEIQTRSRVLDGTGIAN